MNKNIKNKVLFHYDRDGDVLYISIGKPMPASCIEQDDGTMLRVDPKTGIIVGWTIVDYMRRVKDGILRQAPGFENVAMPRY